LSPISGRLSSELASIPDPLLPSLKRGFETAAKLGESDLIAAARSTIERFGPNRETVDPEPIAESLQIPVTQARDFILALSFMAATIFNGDEDSAQFINACVEAGLLPAESAGAITPVVETFSAARPAAKERIAEARLAAAVVASLESIKVAVDVRLSVDNNKVVRWVPMLMLHIETDLYNQELRMQLTRSDAQKVFDEIKKGIEWLDAAEAWARSRQDSSLGS